MNVAQALPLADIWGTRGGWWIVMCVVMMVCMATMMFGHGPYGHTLRPHTTAPWERFTTRETPDEMLDRRFAEGAVSLEDYELRKQQLAGHVSSETAPSDRQPPPAVGAI